MPWRACTLSLVPSVSALASLRSWEVPSRRRRSSGQRSSWCWRRCSSRSATGTWLSSAPQFPGPEVGLLAPVRRYWTSWQALAGTEATALRLGFGLLIFSVFSQAPRSAGVDRRVYAGASHREATSWPGGLDSAAASGPIGSEKMAALQVTGGIRMRASDDYVTPRRSVLERILIRSWEYRRLRLIAGVRISAGIVSVGLGFVTLTFGGADWETYGWAMALLAAGAANLALGYWYITIAYRPFARRVRELERSRARVVDDSAARLRRI